MLKRSLILLVLVHFFDPIIKAASCSQPTSRSACEEAETKRVADFRATTLFQKLSLSQQCLLVSAIQASTAETVLFEKGEPLLEHTLNNPKIMHAIVTIQKANNCSKMQTQEIDALTTTITKQVFINTKTDISPKTLIFLPWENSYTRLEQMCRSVKHPLHLGRYEFTKLFTDILGSSHDDSTKVSPTLAPLFNLTLPIPMTRSQTCCVNSKCTLVAIGGYNGTVQIRSLIDGRKRFSFSHDGAVNCCAFSPDSKWLAVGTNTGSITRWSLLTGEKLNENRTGQAINCLWINPQTTALTVYQFGNIITRWDLTKNTFQSFPFGEASVLAFDSNQTHCAIYRDQETHIVRIEDQALITSLHTGSLTSAQFGYNDESLICISKNKQSLTVWNLISGNQITFAEKNVPITCIALAKAAPSIAFGLENGTLCHVDYQIRGKQWPVAGPVTKVSISADGNRAASLSDEYGIAVVDKKRKQFLYADKQSIPDSDYTEFLLTPDGQYLISTSEGTGTKTFLTIRMLHEQALELLRECSAGQIELIEDLAALTLAPATSQKPLLTRKEKVKLTAYQSALFHFLPDFIKQVLLRTDKILITSAAEVTKV